MMFSMRLLILFMLTALLYAPVINAAIYKWVDEKGVTQYSDKPITGKKSQKVEIAPAPPKEDTDNALQKKQLLLDEDRLKADQKLQTEMKETTKVDKGQQKAETKREAGACVRTLDSLCNALTKADESKKSASKNFEYGNYDEYKQYLYFCTDLNKNYLIDNCEEPVNQVIEKTQAMYKACEKDYGKKCVNSTDKHGKEGVECLVHNQKYISAQCLHLTKGLFRHF